MSCLQSDIPVTIQLVAASNQCMKGSVRMLSQQVDPDWIIAAFEPRPSEVIGVDTGTKTITLIDI